MAVCFTVGEIPAHGEDKFQEEKLLLVAEDTLISVGGLGISPRQALTAFEVKES